MSQETGKCPGCDTPGPVAQPCSEKACLKRGYRFIPEHYWELAHSVEGLPPDPLIGAVLGDYLVVDFVGSGGFGKVFLALQLPLLRLKGALKLIEFTTQDTELLAALLEKFQNEAEALAHLNHPNIVRLLKYGIHADRPYLVMEYVDGGRTLRDEMGLRAWEGRTFSYAEVRHVIHQILNGLEAAHESEIIHRDIKPENIMVQSVAGNPLYTRLLDFGTAKFVKHSGEDTQWPMGSPNYMAPEQTTLKHLGPWTDLYALSIIAFELLSSRRPFEGETEEAVLLKKHDETYDPLHVVQDLGWPPAATTFFSLSLHRVSEERIQDTRTFRDAFDKAIDAMEKKCRPIPLLVLNAEGVPTPGPAPLKPLPASTPLASLVPRVQNLHPALAGLSPNAVTAGIIASGAVGAVLVLSVALIIFTLSSRDHSETLGASAGIVLEESSEDEAGDDEVVDFFFDDELTDEEQAALAREYEVRTIRQVALGKYHSCALIGNGDLRCWGANAQGQLGVGSTRSFGQRAPANRAPIVQLGEPALQVVAAGERRASFTCALLESRNIRCWGANKHGQLGYGHTNTLGDKTHPRELPFVDVGGPVRQITAGALESDAHACALLDSGDVRCWGSNGSGQLGYGHTQSIGDARVPASVAPVKVGGRVKSISAGKLHTCALLDEGSVRCWGNNRQGQLGYGHTKNVGDTAHPADAGDVPVGGLVHQIATGRAHTCALLDEGKMRCWGWNRHGQLGYGHTTNIGNATYPKAAGDIDVGGPVKEIATGGLHTCALLETGNVRCWGDNEFGQLGYGHTRPVGNEYGPWSMGDLPLGGRAVAIEAGDFHTCALLEDERLRCWGLNRLGQLGYGHTRPVGDGATPVATHDVPLW